MIRGYIGRIGSGKTLNMIRDAIQELRKGRKVFTNVPFQYQEKKTKKVFYPILMKDQKDCERVIMQEEKCLVVIDEASVVFSSYLFKSLNSDYVMRFAQGRKFGMDIYWASQGWKHVLKRIRDLTNEVAKCKTIVLFKNKYHFKGIYEPDLFEYNLFTNKLMVEEYTIQGMRLQIGLKDYYKCFDTYHMIDFSMFSAISANVKSTSSLSNPIQKYD